MINIIDAKLKFTQLLTKRSTTNYIVVHHAAAIKCSIYDVHTWHLGRGWSGCGYHFFVSKDGSVYRGRPIDTVRAHVLNNNNNSVGICFEGNYDTEASMPPAQLQAGKDIIAYVQNIYPSAQIVPHNHFNQSACPGKNFPLKTITTKEMTTAEAISKLAVKGIINSPDYWIINAIDGGICKGEYVALLLKRLAKEV